MRSEHKMNASKWGRFCPHGNVIKGNIIRMEALHTWTTNSRYADDAAHPYDSYNEHTDCKSQTCSPYCCTIQSMDNRDRSNMWRESWTWNLNCIRIAGTESLSHDPNFSFLVHIAGHAKYRLSRCDIMSVTNLYPFRRSGDKFMLYQKALTPHNLIFFQVSTTWKSYLLLRRS
jgi:hypothetical protein